MDERFGQLPEPLELNAEDSSCGKHLTSDIFGLSL